MDATAAGPVGAAAQRELVQRILASDLFAKSHRLAAFLKFICEQYAAGNSSSINEQRIGTEVFGRAPGYHVGEDSIVRSQARFLRQRLEEYFATEGKREPVVLLIPKGSYVPAFEWRRAEAAPEAAVAVPLVAEVAAPASRRWMVPVLSAALVAAVAVAGVLGYKLQARRKQAANDPPLVRAFWGSVFAPQRAVLIVPSDSSLVLLEEMTEKPVSLQAYASHEYLNVHADPPMALWETIATSQYTNMADVNMVGRLEKLPEAEGVPLTLRYARELSLKELKESNAILIGGARSNPWVELYEAVTKFDVDYDYVGRHNVVRNRSVQSGEQALYIEDRSDPTEPSRAYGVVTYVPSLDGLGHTLLLEGTSKAGTEAAGEFLSSPGFAGFLKTAGATERGVPAFEVLIATSSMAGASYRPEVVCWHLLGKAGS